MDLFASVLIGQTYTYVCSNTWCTDIHTHTHTRLGPVPLVHIRGDYSADTSSLVKERDRRTHSHKHTHTHTLGRSWTPR